MSDYDSDQGSFNGGSGSEPEVKNYMKKLRHWFNTNISFCS